MLYSLMPKAFFLPALAVLAIALAQQGTEQDPRVVVETATAAVRTGTDAQFSARLRARETPPDGDRASALGLATIARLTYDYDAAEGHYRKLFVINEERPDGYDIQARIGLGMALEAQGESGDRVAELFRTALARARRAGDSTGAGEALLRIGSLLAPQGGAGAGLAYLDSAARTLPPSAEGLRAAARCRRSQFMVATLMPGAGDSLAAAMAAARQAADPDAEGFCLRAATVHHRLRDDPDSATIAELALIDLRRRVRDRSGLSMALMVHADHIRSQGRFGESNRLIHEAGEEARASKNRFIEATVALAIGGTSLLMNDHAVAKENIERAIASFEASNDSASLMFALSYRPFVSMAAGDLDRAREQTRALIEYWRKHGDYDHLTELYRQLASIEMRAGDNEAAERALDDAMAVANRIGTVERGGVEYDRGRLALRRGDLAGAEAGFRGFLSKLESSERLPRYEGRLRLSEVFARRGELERAERELSAAGEELDAWRKTLGDPEFRALAFQASAFEANDRNVSVAIVLGALAAGGHATTAFELAEHRRARELSERMARTAALRETPDSTSLAISAGGIGLSERRPLGATDIARAIPDDSTAILEFVTASGGAPSTLFVVTRDVAEGSEVVAYRLPAADSLVADIGRLVTVVENGGDPEKLERALGAVLLDSALQALGSGIVRLVIVPDGPLHRMPWDVLRLQDARYVAERYAVGIAPSAAIAATMWMDSASRPSPGARVLAFGDPEFADARVVRPDEEVYRSALESTGGLPRLPNSAREARLVAGYGDKGESRVGPEATAAYLKQVPLAGFDVLHFATHALIDDRVSTRSVLALGGTAGESGFLSGADLAGLDLDDALVVLSACRSAGGVIVDGEGVQGLTAPLLQAGARAVVATAWRISDRATVPFVEAFYDAMASGLPVASALRSAKVDAIRRGAPPGEWAAFTVVGDPFLRVSLVEPPQRPRWLMFAITSLVLLAALMLLAGRRWVMRQRVSPAAG